MQRGTVDHLGGADVQSAAAGLTARAIYARVADPETIVPGGQLLAAIRSELNRFGPEPTTGLDDLQRAARAWSTEDGQRYLALRERSDDVEGQHLLTGRAALGCAPLARLSGAWLQWLSAPGNADETLTLRILALYASDVGVGHPSASRGAIYLDLLRGMQLAEHAVPASRLPLDQRVADGAFLLPAVLIAMGRRPDDLRPEILGADLCLRSAGLLPALAVVRAALPHAVDWAAMDSGAGRTATEPAAVELCRGIVDALVATGGDVVSRRVVAGFGWALNTLRRWSDELFAELQASRDPAYDMAELVRRRAREGAIYHHDYQLEGRPLAEWLQECRTDPRDMLRALAASKLVKPGRSESSALASGLLGERGPMFRVFAPEDVTIIRRWIDSLPTATTPERSQAQGLDITLGGPPDRLFPSLTAPPGGEDKAPATVREAYCQLLRRTSTPALRRFALGYVRGWLARSRHGLEHGENQLPRHWSPEGLRPWLAEQHDRHDLEFQEGAQTRLPSRDELIRSTVQLAPLTLIDGAWLQGFTDYEHASSETGYFLFETYWDELGNGETHLNHPLIYREVLAEMSIELPATASPEFAGWPGFDDRSFELPVYWLSIGRFPRTFLPEVLGLNLAMELSGVGGGYRRSRIALKAHGFSTRFVDIHNTIDNVAAGHSAWAADAVDSYLAALSLSQGTAALAETWERVRVGYRSLNPPDGYWARRAERRGRKAGERD
jgi:hypothetical protein